MESSVAGLVWFGFMAHEPLQAINANSIFIHIKTVLFQTIQLSMQKQFYFKQYSFALVNSLVIFDS